MEKLAAQLKEFNWNIDKAIDWPEYRNVTKSKGYILVSRPCHVKKPAATLTDVK